MQEFLQRLSRALELEALVLFGSRARGEHLHCSDVDVVVVSASFEGLSVEERLKRVQEVWPGGRALEPISATAEELKDIKRLVLCDALEEGLVLFDRGAWAGAKRRFDELKSRGQIRKTRTGWQFGEAGQ